jgi:uncharacterized OB-fold protein
MSFPYLPVEDSVSAPFWAATRERRFVLQKCVGCSQYQHYPRALCSHCGGINLEYHEVSGTGHIDSWTEVMRAPQEGFAAPYVIARVRLIEGPIVLTQIVDIPSSQISCEQPVRLTWRPLSDGRALPLFSPQGE